MPAKSPEAPDGQTRWARWSFRIQFGLSVALALAVLVYVAFLPELRPPEPAPVRPALTPVVESVGERLVRVEPGSSLARKLDTAVVEFSRVSIPKMRVTGTVAASLRPIGTGNDPEQWQFDNPEVLATFHEWQRAQVDVNFAREQLSRIQELNETRILAQRRVVERMERLVRAGTDAEADLEVARAELLEREIEARRDEYEAETEIRRARQEDAVLVRQLQVTGLDPSILEEATLDVDVVVADVPEESLGRVRVGQQCEARFFGLPGRIFPGEVRSIAPVLSPERRSLRVLFFVDDPDDDLRPGMFADIGLGTEPRETLLIATESVIHIGRDDFAFVQDGEEPDRWRVTRVEVGDVVNGMMEIFSGLQPGDRVISAGAILLKPAAVASMDPESLPVRPVDPIRPAPEGRVLEEESNR